MNRIAFAAVPEQTLFIDLPKTDGLKIKAILRGSLKGPLAIIMHGRPGTGDDLLPYLGARYLYEQGINSLRLFMYDYDDKTRNLVDCTLQTHVDDFETVLDYVRKRGVSPVFGIGHSYGGMTIVKSAAELDGAVLWDPSHGLAWQKPGTWKHKKEAGDYVFTISGKGGIMSKQMNEQDYALGDTSDWAATISYPLEVITAVKGPLAKFAPRYAAAAKGTTKVVEINEATHNFRDSDEIMIRLFDETGKWFKEIL